MKIEKNNEIDLPQNLVEQELSLITKNSKTEEINKNKIKNEKLAKSRIKLGLILKMIRRK